MNCRSKTSLRQALGMAAFLFLVFPVLTLVGCSGGGGGKVSGKVTANGQPVNGGTLTFSPIGESGNLNPGAPAQATVGADGTYTAEKVVVGKARVSYLPPTDAGGAGPTKRSPYEGLAPKVKEVDVKAGGTIDIELAPK